jgi:hypothetical protein
MLNNSIYTIIYFALSLHKYIFKMGYKAKIQRVDRGATKSFYINFPAAVAEACILEKGEEMEWIIEDKNTFVLQRVKTIPARQTHVEEKKKTNLKTT